MLLRESKHGVDDEKRAHDREVGVLPEYRRQHNDELEHLRRDAREFAHEHEDGWACFGDLVEAFVLPACLHVRAKEPRPGIGVQRRERLFRGFGEPFAAFERRAYRSGFVCRACTGHHHTSA